jgi:hypothetical protein
LLASSGVRVKGDLVALIHHAIVLEGTKLW